MNAIIIPKLRMPFLETDDPGSAHARHVPALDGIRGLAILLVTLYRFSGAGDHAALSENLVTKSLSLGYRGVDLFFVLSGFLITGILLDAKSDAHFFRNFYARRALRIFPLYFGTLFIALIALPLLSHHLAALFSEPRERQWWLWLYGSNLFQAWNGKWAFGCFNHFWSLAVEEHFYFVWPIVIYLSSRRGAIAACVVTIVLAASSRVAWLLFGGNDVAPEVFTLFRADGLAMGGLIAVLAKEPGGIAPWVRSAQCSVCILGPLLLLLAIGDRRFLNIPETLFAIFFASVIVCAVAAPKGSSTAAAWNSKFLRFFGKYSYAMYVFQYPLIPSMAPILTAELLSERSGSVFLGRLLYVILMTTVATGSAVVSWHVLEKRALKLKRHFEPVLQTKKPQRIAAV